MKKLARSPQELRGIYCKYCMNKYRNEWLEYMEMHEKDFYAGTKNLERLLSKMHSEAEDIRLNNYDAAEQIIESGICVKCYIHEIGMPSIYDVVDVGKKLLAARMLKALMDGVDEPNRRMIIKELRKHTKQLATCTEEDYSELGTAIKRRREFRMVKKDSM